MTMSKMFVPRKTLKDFIDIIVADAERNNKDGMAVKINEIRKRSSVGQIQWTAEARDYLNLKCASLVQTEVLKALNLLYVKDNATIDKKLLKANEINQ